MNLFFCSAFCFTILNVTNFSFAEAVQETWQEFWFEGSSYFRNGEYDSAIKEYTQAIDALESKNLAKHLYLFYERGYAFFKSQNYKNAIEDLSIIINNEASSKEEKLQALWLRSQAFLLSGSINNFMKDMELVKKLDPITNISEDASYASFKLGQFMQSRQDIVDQLIKTLVINHIVNSENDVVITPDGMVIMKKSKSADKNALTKFINS